ncbi:UDP-glycosyltransferase UGT5-like [Schistocerca piceifrons]|uniref:UDP-glycosyltransferase UGT5-like n=1 Tax=Schistocerca piceifrons TaxID=274613 RepID=UPI001F5FCFC1|nr:UDP-glycosyltransferase UGT5-like [Schistocerca piceifrons]
MGLLSVVLVVVASLACLPQPRENARVLSVFPVPMRSHWIVCRSLLEALHDRGHQLTVLTPYPTGRPRRNWTELIVPDTMHLLGGTSDLFSLGQRSDFVWLLRLFNYGISSCEVFLQQENVQQLFESDREFDVIIIETFFNDCLMALAHKFRAPVIAISTLVGTVWMSDMMGSPYPLSYVAEPFLSYTDRMPFWQRLHNAAFATYARLVRRLYYAPRQDALVRRHVAGPSLPSVLDIERNTSLLFLNSHPSLHFPRPLAPNVIEIGGMHVCSPRTLPQAAATGRHSFPSDCDAGLPPAICSFLATSLSSTRYAAVEACVTQRSVENLQEFLDSATDGAILFSLGSNIKSSQMPDEKRAAFLTAFSQLKQRVLWKWETEDLPGKPENLKVSKWLPQSDILAHKNLKLFITHGGLGSTLEAVHHGVPLIGVPVFADQDSNMIRAEQHGYALRLQFSNITADTLLWAITEVLDNPRYRQQVQQLSRVFHDRPRAPLEEAVFWTEYVVRHGGGPHLRSPALHLSWHQVWLLDVVAAVVAAAVAVLALLTLAVKAATDKLSSKRLTAAVHRAAIVGSKKHM